MKHLSFAAVVAVALMSAAPAFASPLNEQGITREEMVEVMLADGLPACATDRLSHGVDGIEVPGSAEHGRSAPPQTPRDRFADPA